MQRFKDLKISIKLISSFLVLTIVPLAVIGMVSINLSSNGLSREAFNKLKTSRQTRKIQIKSFFAGKIADIRVLADDPFTMEAMKELKAAFDADGGVNGAGLKDMPKAGLMLRTFIVRYVTDSFHISNIFWNNMDITIFFSWGLIMAIPILPLQRKLISARGLMP